jgi:hypothetical protein
MAALSAFTPRIAALVDGCPDPTIEQAVLDACIEFCERTHILKQTLDAVTLLAGVRDVDIDLPAGYKVVRTLKVWIDGSEVGAATEGQIESPLMVVDSISNVDPYTGTPFCYSEVLPGTIRLFPATIETCTLNARVALKPARGSKTVDDLLFENWAEAISDGALLRLFAMPERFGDGKRAVYHDTRFRQALGQAKQEAVAGRTSPRLRVRPVSFV